MNDALRALVQSRPTLKLDLGCGNRKRGADWVGVDRAASEGVDVVGDALEVLASLPAGSVDLIHSSHFLEHVDDVASYVEQFARTLKPGGCAEIVVPHFSNALYYSDPTHRTPFGLYTFCYFAECSLFARQVPSYVRNPRLRLDEVTLGFKASKPFYLRYAFRRAVGAIVNLTRFTQEFYEDCLSGVVSCYEIRYRLTRLSGPAAD